MKNEKVNISGTVLAATGAVITLFASQVYCASFHAIWPSTGAPNGTLKVQGTNMLSALDSELPSTTDSEWEDISGSSQAIAGSAGSKLFNLDGIGYRFIRLYWLRTSGSLTISKGSAFSKG